MSTKSVLSAPAAEMIARFTARLGAVDGAAESLRSVIAGSSYLINQLNTAVANGDLTQIDVLPDHIHAAGEYSGDERELRLRVGILTHPLETACTLGHEVQHALNRGASERASQQFDRDVDRAGRGDRDYTPATRRALAALRADEAGATLAGWNAMIDYVHDQHPNASLPEIIRATPRSRDFFDWQGLDDQPRLKPELIMNQDHQFDLTPANVEATGRHSFDKPAEEVRLGYRGNSDYANLYGASIVSTIAQQDRASNPRQQGSRSAPLRLDLAACGLHRSVLEQNGIDLGDDHEPVPYLDASADPARTERLHHTIGTHRYIPDDVDRDRDNDATRLAALSQAAQRPGSATRQDPPATARIRRTPTRRLAPGPGSEFG